LERVMVGIWSVIDLFLVGKADRYKGITGQDIAKAMKASAIHQSQKVTIYHWKEMNNLVRG
jgi:hypothetical protein